MKERVPLLTVMQSFAATRRTTNPYLLQLVDSVADSVHTVNFSWSNALRGRFDVLHLHWPENLCRSPTRWKAWLRRVAFFVLLMRIRWSRRALVRTLHNSQPHEKGGRVEKWLLDLCDRTTTVWIALSAQTAPPVPDARVVVIPHGDYRTWFSGFPHPTAEAGRILYFGLIRPYKGVESLLGAFGSINDPTLTLRIAGKPVEPGLAAQIVAAGRSDERISADLTYIDDAQLAAEVGRSELVVLPYRDLQNSGSLLLALSLDRPVLVPDNDMTRELADEVGQSWIQRYSGRTDRQGPAGRCRGRCSWPPVRRPRPFTSQLGHCRQGACRGLPGGCPAVRHEQAPDRGNCRGPGQVGLVAPAEPGRN